MGRYRQEGVMRKSKRARLKAAGWVIGSGKECLGLSEAEAVLIEMKLALSQSLRDRRRKQGLSQSSLPNDSNPANLEWPKWKPVIRQCRWISWSVPSYSLEPAPPIWLKPFREEKREQVLTPPRAMAVFLVLLVRFPVRRSRQTRQTEQTKQTRQAVFAFAPSPSDGGVISLREMGILRRESTARKVRNA